MTPEAVDKVLDEVRPYLMADGGDVEVAAVENGNIYLTLQGSCSSCASSSVTMKMGIERALKAAYGDRLKEVIQVGPCCLPAALPAFLLPEPAACCVAAVLRPYILPACLPDAHACCLLHTCRNP